MEKLRKNQVRLKKTGFWIKIWSMQKFKFLKRGSVSKLPAAVGVYALAGKNSILYIGKAVNVKKRVQSHLARRNYKDGLFADEVSRVGYILTDSEIEALLLEAELIKRLKPKYNTVWRDDKNFFYVGISREQCPRVFLTHQTDDKEKVRYIGPFVEGKALKKTLRFLRKIFPYYTVRKHPPRPCTWCHLGLCPGPEPDKKAYQQNINNLTAVLKGRRSSVIKKLRKEMAASSRKQEYEMASSLRDRIASLESVMANAHIIEEKKEQTLDWKKTERELRKIFRLKKKIERMEGYDVSNIQGQKATGSMVTFEKGEPNKDLYRKFRIRMEARPNDTAMIKEVLRRRLNHREWKLPEIILIDGGKAQLNAAVEVRDSLPRAQKLKIAALAKRNNDLYLEGRRKSLALEELPRGIFNLILRLRDEAHRFALAYHKKLRAKSIAP